MNIFIKVFLITGIPFGILAGIITSIYSGVIYRGLISGLFAGIVFGLSFVVLTLFHVFLSMRIESGSFDEITGIHHIRSIELQLPYKDVHELCLESLILFGGYRIKEDDYLQGKIVTEIAPSMRSYGEIISFDLNQINEDSTLVNVSSRPMYRFTVIDFGKNLENVVRIIQYLKEHRVMKQLD